MDKQEGRKIISEAKDQETASLKNQAMALKDKGYTNAAIAAEMGLPESTVRRLVK